MVRPFVSVVMAELRDERITSNVFSLFVCVCESESEREDWINGERN